MATSARLHWPPPRGFVSAYVQNLMAADTYPTPLKSEAPDSNAFPTEPHDWHGDRNYTIRPS